MATSEEARFATLTSASRASPLTAILHAGAILDSAVISNINLSGLRTEFRCCSLASATQTHHSQWACDNRNGPKKNFAARCQSQPDTQINGSLLQIDESHCSTVKNALLVLRHSVHECNSKVAGAEALLSHTKAAPRMENEIVMSNFDIP